MNYAVRNYTKTGNTKNLVDKAASVLDVEAETTATPLTEHVDKLFLASSVYAAGVDAEVISFINENKDKIGEIINLSTAALLPSTYKQVKKLATKNNIKMSDKEFHCRESFGKMHKNHPDADDLLAIRNYTK